VVSRTRLTLLALTVALVAGAAAAAARSANGIVQVTPIGRLPFPERGYVVDLPSGTVVAPSAVRVRENGKPVRDIDVSPLGEAGIHFGAVLALDASQSMTGEPLRAAVAAARSFLAHRAAGQEVGLIAFNSGVHVLTRPTADAKVLQRQFAVEPPVAYGTRIYDALDRSLTLLDSARLSTGSIVLLSDGADIGSTSTIADEIEKAQERHVRIFTVGLRSGAFRAGPLQRLASETGGTFVEATSPRQLGSVYSALSQRLSGEYVVRYRSNAEPQAHVRVSIDIANVGSQTYSYTAPTPSGLAPFHRSLLSRFLLSGASPLAISLLIALLVATVILLVLRSSGTRGVVERVSQFAGSGEPGEPESEERDERRAPLRRAGGGMIARIDRQLEIARIDMSAEKVVLLTIGGTVLACLMLGVIVPVFALLGVLVPFITRALIQRKLRQVRDAFADQLAPNLQVLASALRVGHSFIAAFTVVVENAHEPSKSELQRVVADERLGVPPEVSLRRVAERMASRDLEQVALLAELQRTAGGNAAEVLDTVVETLRERADVRRLVRTLTAQGRLARWILSALPPVAGLAFFVVDPPAIKPLVQSGVGQVGLVFAAFLVVSGSLVIQRIIDIKV
jgi:tight adherence protein B